MAGIHEGRRPEGASNRRVVEDHIPCMASHNSVVLLIDQVFSPRALLKSSLTSYTCLEIRFLLNTPPFSGVDAQCPHQKVMIWSCHVWVQARCKRRKLTSSCVYSRK